MGVTPTMKVAVMGDVQASVYNINGLESNVDAHDGSADNNMLWHILENLSLQDAAVGEDAKPILHDFTPYGTARLFKYATFGQYNERLRKSQTSPINQYIQFRKQNSLTWNDEIPQRYNAYNPDPHWTIELGINLYGNKFTLKDVEYLKGVYINKDSSIYSVYNYLMEKGITGTPIVEDNNKYVGIVTIKDIAKQIINGNVSDLDAKYDNILSVLEGEEVLKFDEEIKGNLLVASYKSTTFLNLSGTAK